MTATTQMLDDVLGNLDDELAPVEGEDQEDTNEEVIDEETDTTEETTEDTTEEEDSADDDDGYTIDEAESENEDDETITTEERQDDQATNQALAALTPEQRYIIQNIQPITVRGRIGDSDEIKEFKAFDPGQLPAGFKYVDDREHDIAAKSFGKLEQQAEQLQNKFREEANQKSSREFKEANDRADWEDISFLQKEGELPKFKIRPNEKGFEDDPAAKLIQEIMDFKDERNAKYLKDASEKGRPFRMIGFEEAFRMYKPKADAKTTEQKNEDAERKGLAKRTTKTNGQRATEATTDRVRLSSSRDLSNYIDNLDI